MSYTVLKEAILGFYKYTHHFFSHADVKRRLWFSPLNATVKSVWFYFLWVGTLNWYTRSCELVDKGSHEQNIEST